MVQYTESLRDLFETLKYMQPPSLKGQEWNDANWDKSRAKVPEKAIRCAIRDGLPDLLKHELDEKQVYYGLMADTHFVNALKDIEVKDIRVFEVRDKDKAILKKKSSKPDPDVCRRPPNRNKRKKESRRTIQGTVRYFFLCKKSGMSEKTFKPHHTENCHYKKEILKKSISGGVASRNDAQKTWKKENKIISKKLINTENKLKRLCKSLMKIQKTK